MLYRLVFEERRWKARFTIAERNDYRRGISDTIVVRYVAEMVALGQEICGTGHWKVTGKHDLPETARQDHLRR